MSAPSEYVLGHSDQELEPLQRQAACLERVTRKLIRECGIATGMRVLDIGCLAGDVSMLVGEAVEGVGQVFGIDPEQRAVQFAKH
jgi:ubiquinone/menaquinone biosynthesis C-methylase UbiE